MNIGELLKAIPGVVRIVDSVVKGFKWLFKQFEAAKQTIDQKRRQRTRDKRQKLLKRLEQARKDDDKDAIKDILSDINKSSS